MRKSILHLIFLIALLAHVVAAAPFSRLYSYGDSLSDPAFTNGPVAVQYLANQLGIAPANLFNYAVGGATTGVGNYLDLVDFGTGSVTDPSPRGGMLTQLGASQMAGINPTDALFVVWGGPNDFSARSPLDLTTEAVVARAITNLVTIVMTLQAAGAQHILVPGLPMLGLTPFYASDPVAAAQANALSIGFNMALKASLPPGVTFFDTAAFMQKVVMNPAAYGLTNVTEMCLVGANLCANPEQYLFLNDFHPTTAAHALLANEFASAVPEPASVVLVFAGIGVFAASRRLRAR